MISIRAAGRKQGGVCPRVLHQQAMNDAKIASLNADDRADHLLIGKIVHTDYDPQVSFGAV